MNLALSENSKKVGMAGLGGRDDIHIISKLLT